MIVPHPQGWCYSIVSNSRAGEEQTVPVFFPEVGSEEHAAPDKATWNSGSLNPRGKYGCALDTNFDVQLGFHSRNGEKADETQLQPFVSFKNNTKKPQNPMRPAGVSGPSQSSFWPFIARFIALVSQEMLLKVVYFNV